MYRQSFNTLHSVCFLLLAEYFRSAFSKVAYLYLASFNKQCQMHDTYSVIEHFRSAFQKFCQIKHQRIKQFILRSGMIFVEPYLSQTVYEEYQQELKNLVKCY